MGCRSDYLEANEAEIENSKVLALFEEVKTGKLPEYFGNGHTEKVYNKTTQKVLDKNTEKLCTSLQGMSSSKLKKSSLELQMWWRDHQKLDKKRLSEELKAKKDEKAKKKAIEKLTPYERKLLGITSKKNKF
ncbi:MAG: hypothetical protein AABY15_02580 [Nanoarchaeota archaeon]